MRTEQEILSLLSEVGTADPGILAILLNGSRVNDKIERDRFQDMTSLFPAS